MLPYLTNQTFGNPSSAHRCGRAARAGMEQARSEVAEAVGAEPSQVIFTSGGTEADNLGIVGAALAARERGAPCARWSPPIEHKAILAAAHAVCRLGGREVVLPVNTGGAARSRRARRRTRRSPRRRLGDVGEQRDRHVQPIAEIAERVPAAGVLFHTDAVQAFGKMPVCSPRPACTLLTLSGPQDRRAQGYRRARRARPHGGRGHHPRRRPAARPPAGHGERGGRRGAREGGELAVREQAAEADRLRGLRDDLADRLESRHSRARRERPRSGERAPHVLSMAVAGADSEAMLMHLDIAGVAASGAPPARPARSSRRTCCWRWACHAISRSGACASASGTGAPRRTWTGWPM